jgi:phosphoribosylaminoimidazole-succinocarboxamide synthase
MTVSQEILTEGLSKTLKGTNFESLGRKYEGKVRDCYITDGRRYIVVTDRISAFDRVLTTLPFKGQVLNGLAAHWFRETREVAPNHMLSVPDENVLEARQCEPLPVELVVRAYLTGVTSTSIWTHYERGERVFCGHRLPDGLRKHEALPEPILTPSTKAEKGGHDVSASREEILSMGKVSARDFDAAAEIAMALFAFGQRRCAERGLILVDTKYELGFMRDELLLIDEIHTPDSSRFWIAEGSMERFEKGESQQMLDKENLRQWLITERGFSGQGTPPAIPDDVRVMLADKYLTAYERITGSKFDLKVGSVTERLEKNLKAAKLLS